MHVDTFACTQSYSMLQCAAGKQMMQAMNSNKILPRLFQHLLQEVLSHSCQETFFCFCFYFLPGIREQTQLDTKQYTRPLAPAAQMQLSIFQRLLIETCLPVAEMCKSVSCVCVCVSVAIHSIRMLQHSHAVHCQRCPLCNLGQPRRLHYHINYIHVAAPAVDWWYCYGFYALEPHWKQSK